MAFTKITEEDLTGKGVTGLPDTPGLSTTNMQEKFDELSVDVIVPKHNSLIDELEADTAAASLGAVDGNGNPSTVQAELNGIKQQGYTKAEADALYDTKVDKVDGMGLSANDFSDAYRQKLNGIDDNANNYVLPAGTQSTLGGVMGDGTTFTIDSNGVGHAVGGGGGTADYDALINKPELNGVEIIGTKESEDYGILRPYLLITSDAGSTVTIKKGTTIIPATQVTGSTTQWEVCPTSYGTWTVKSALAGADDASATVTVDAVKTYAVTVNHISATITATYPAGATYCTCTKGSTTYTATSNPQTFTVSSLGTWTIECEVDGIVKTATATISADGDSQSVTIEFAEIDITYASAFEGAVVTCTDGVSTYTKTAPVGGSTLSFAIPNTGTWTVSATVGGTLYTYSVSVVAYTTYTVTMATFSATITVTYPYSLGASCSITDGVTTLTATTSPMAFNIPNTGSWQATAVLDGVSKAGQSITITTDGQTETDTIEYGTINLTYANEFRGQSITCTQGGTTITKTAPSAGNSLAFYPPTTGTWDISGTYSGTPYSTSATVSSLSTAVSATLETIPNGSTVTPTDDIQTWLRCAQITGKSYTTLAQVLADSETYNRLLSDSNACDYMARSTTWSIATGQVPQMTGYDTPSGEVIYSPEYSTEYKAYYAFDGNASTSYSPQASTSTFLGYKFTTKKLVRVVKYKGNKPAQGSPTLTLQASDDNNTWQNIAQIPWTENEVYIKDNSNTTSYLYWRVLRESTIALGNVVNELQFYTDVDIPSDANAMFQLGKYDYACDALLADSTWASAIVNSAYIEGVLNVKVPTLSSQTAQVITTDTNGNIDSNGWWTYDNNPSTAINPYNHTQYPLCFVGYDFTTAVRVNAIKIGQDYYGSSSGNLRVIKCEVYASNDGTNYSLIDTVNNLPDVASMLFPINNTTAYRYYKLALFNYADSTYMQINTVQFYGRTSNYDASKITFHGAIGGSLYYLDGGTPQTLATIDTTTKIAQVSKSSVPKGTYAIYDTAAKDPDNLTDDYSKTITITDNTTEVWIIPDYKGLLYWYGNESSNLENMNTTNGWSVAGRTFGTPAHNTSTITIQSASTSEGGAVGVGTQTALAVTKCNVISKGQTSPYGHLAMFNTKSPNDYAKYLTFNSASDALYSITQSGTYYMGVYAIDGAGNVLSALWYE